VERILSQPTTAALAHGLDRFAPRAEECSVAATTGALHHFAFNTCNGCHAAQETNTVFVHISPRTPSTEAQLSSFLAGVTFADPATRAVRVFDELGRRKLDLEGLVWPGAPVLAGTSLRKRIDRVH
jgi:hypothetical protein